MTRTLVAGLLAATLLSLCVGARADDHSTDRDALINAVVDAYGGAAALDGIHSLHIREVFSGPAYGQSWDATVMNINNTGQEVLWDRRGGQARFTAWFSSRAGLFRNLLYSNGEQATSIDIDGVHSSPPNSDPYQFAGGSMRTTDLVLVLELHERRDEAELLDEADWQDRPHRRVRLPFPSSPDLTLWFDADSHLLTRMVRDNPILGQLDYTWRNHRAINGITRASGADFYIAGAPNLLGMLKEVTVNPPIAGDAFTPPSGPQRETFDGSEMVVNRIADNVVHIGQGPGYTLFVDTADGLVAAGGYPGLSDRLARFRETTGNHRPLRWQVVTHHHSDHLGGLQEAIDLGATLVTVAGNTAGIETFVPGAAGHRYQLVDGRMSFGNGRNRVDLYDVSTIHAYSNLVVHVPGQDTLFIVDHLNTPYAEGTPRGNPNTVSMWQALQPLDLDVRRIVTAHGGRVYAWRDFERSVQTFQAIACPSGDRLCAAVLR